MSLRRTQMPSCPHRSDRIFEVVRVRRGNGMHLHLRCQCGKVAGNPAKAKRLVRYDAELAAARREELRKRRSQKTNP